MARQANAWLGRPWRGKARLIMNTIKIMFLLAFIGVIPTARAVPSNIDVVRYSNLSTAQSLIKVRIKDAPTRRIYTIVVGNLDFYKYLKGKINIGREEYVSFMRRDFVLDIDIKDFAGDIVTKELSFEDLGVGGETEFLEVYFEPTGDDCFIIRNQFDNPAFDNPNMVAFILDMNFDVIHDDYTQKLFLMRP